MTRSMEKPFMTSCALCLILLCGIVFALCPPAFAKDPQIDVKELARTQNSWDGALLPAYPEGQPEIRILSPRERRWQSISIR